MDQSLGLMGWGGVVAGGQQSQPCRLVGGSSVHSEHSGPPRGPTVTPCETRPERALVSEEPEAGSARTDSCANLSRSSRSPSPSQATWGMAVSPFGLGKPVWGRGGVLGGHGPRCRERAGAGSRAVCGGALS